jgi:hypothetical protein
VTAAPETDTAPAADHWLADRCQVYLPDLDLDPSGYLVFECGKPQDETTPWYMIPLAGGKAARVPVCTEHAAEFIRKYGPPPPPPEGHPRTGPVRPPEENR